VSTPLIDTYRERFRQEGLPLLTADEVAGAVLAAATSAQTGQAWVCQPGRPCEPYRFRGVPGPGAHDQAAGPLQGQAGPHTG
jgi:hypothetical protein